VGETCLSGKKQIKGSRGDQPTLKEEDGQDKRKPRQGRNADRRPLAVSPITRASGGGGEVVPDLRGK